MGRAVLGWLGEVSEPEHVMLRILDFYLWYNSNSKAVTGLGRRVTHSDLSFRRLMCLRVEKGLAGAQGKRGKRLQSCDNLSEAFVPDDAKF